MKRVKPIIVFIALTFILKVNSKELSASEFASLSPKEAVLESHKWHKKGGNLVVIKPTVIEATFNNDEKVSIPLKDEFFVSIAPYINFTHNCTYHVPTGCTGEMIDKEMHIKISDNKTGEVISDKEIKTQHDGFIDLWLPRNKDFLVSFNYNDKKASQIISTYEDDITCITTMKLD